MINNNIEYLYENLKAGDVLGFWRKGLLSYVIRYFQKLDKTNNLDKVCHVGAVHDVRRCDETMSFGLSHQTGDRGGVYETWIIKKTFNEQAKRFQYKLTTKTKYTSVYFLELDKKFTKKQEEKARNDAENESGKRYGYFSFWINLPAVSKWIGKNDNKYGFLDRFKRVCSRHVLLQHFYAGRNVKKILDKNPRPTPEFILTCNEDDFKGKLHNITDWKRCL